MEGDDELLRGLGVTARGERDVARDVIRDAAVAAAAREAAARDARRGGDGGGRGDVADDAGGDGDAGPSDAGTSGGGGGGDGPVTKELARLREESERLARELGAVRDALDEVRERQKNGDAPVDAALQIAVGERRVQGLTDKRDALAAKIDDAAPKDRNTKFGIPGITPMKVKMPPAMKKASGLASCLPACSGEDSEVATRVTMIAVASERIMAGSWATRPSPMVSKT